MNENRPDLGVVVLGVYVVVTLYSLADSQDRNFRNKTTTRPRVKRLALLCWLTSHEEEDEEEEEEFKKKKVAAVKCSSIITMIEITKGTGGGGSGGTHPLPPPPPPPPDPPLTGSPKHPQGQAAGIVGVQYDN